MHTFSVHFPQPESLYCKISTVTEQTPCHQFYLAMRKLSGCWLPCITGLQKSLIIRSLLFSSSGAMLVCMRRFVQIWTILSASCGACKLYRQEGRRLRTLRDVSDMGQLHSDQDGARYPLKSLVLLDIIVLVIYWHNNAL